MPTATRRYFSNVAALSALAADCTATDNLLTLTTLAGQPTSFPYTLTIARNDLTKLEVVEVTAQNTSTNQVTVNRGVDGTTNVVHHAGDMVEHDVTARDFDQANLHASTASVSTAHGMVGQGDVTNGYLDLSSAQTIAGTKTFSIAPVVPDGSFTIAKTTSLQSTLDAKYSAANPPPYPVTSAAGRTGAVTFTAADIAAGTFPAGIYVFAGAANVQAGDGTAASAVRVNSAAGTTKIVDFQSAGLSRWKIQVTGTAESGGNVGSDLTLKRFDDTGVLIDTPLTITRSTGAWVFAGALTVTASGANSGLVVQNSAAAGRGPELALLDTKAGQATPNKFIRANGGLLQVINSAYSADILDLDDAGNLTLPHGGISDSSGQVYSPGHPPPYPVTSVAGRTGAVVLTAADIGAQSFPAGAFTFSGPNSSVTIVRQDAAAGLNISNFVDQDLQFRVTANGASDKYSLIYASTAGRLAFGTSSVERMSIDNTGKLTVQDTVTAPKSIVPSPTRFGDRFLLMGA